MNFKRRQKLLEEIFLPSEGGIRARYDELNPKEVPPLVLAYIGDAYYHLFVRERLLSYHRSCVEILTDIASEIVSAIWQAKAFGAVSPLLTEEELAVYRRGRNAKSHAPRSSSAAEYHTSTGFEALLGYLYLNHQSERLPEIADVAFEFCVSNLRKD